MVEQFLQASLVAQAGHDLDVADNLIFRCRRAPLVVE